MELSRAQKLIKFFSSKAKFEKMKEESMQWKFDCECGKTSSILEVGGIRYKAKGEPTKFLPCPACGSKAMRKVYKSK